MADIDHTQSAHVWLSSALSALNRGERVETTARASIGILHALLALVEQAERQGQEHEFAEQEQQLWTDVERIHGKAGEDFAPDGAPEMDGWHDWHQNRMVGG